MVTYRLQASIRADSSFELIDVERQSAVTEAEGYLETGLDGTVRFKPRSGKNLARIIAEYEGSQND